MKTRFTNPFVTGGYVAPGYFCDRTVETTHLLNAISSKRNVTLISLRRMGKTGLLHHVKHLTEQNKHSSSVIYVDLMPTMNANEMLNALSSALLDVKKGEKGFFEKVLSVLASFRPKLTYDSLTGQPAIELGIASPAEIQSGLNSLLHLISEIKQELVIMFDEFQQISQYPEKNIEQMLRSVIQSHPSIPFIFSGSSKHMLEAMFSAAGRPFYQSSELMYLDKIPEEEYRKFILEKFESGGKKVSNENLSILFKWTRLHTFYVQHVCNRLYETDLDIIDEALINNTLYGILNSYEPLFSGYRKLIPHQQFALLQAIAIEDGIAQPTSGSFVKTHNLVSASSVTTSLKALAEKELILSDGNNWLVYDVFLSRWLQYNYSRK